MFYQLSNMLPQIFRVSSTLTLTSSKHWGIGETLLEPILLTQQTHTHTHKKTATGCSFLEGRKRVSKRQPPHKYTPHPHTHFQQNWTWPGDVLRTRSCQRCLFTRRCNGFAGSSKTGRPVNPMLQPGEQSKAAAGIVFKHRGGWGWGSLCWQTFTTLWHQLPSARDYSIFFFLPLRACSLGATLGRMSEASVREGKKWKRSVVDKRGRGRMEEALAAVTSWTWATFLTRGEISSKWLK